MAVWIRLFFNDTRTEILLLLIVLDLLLGISAALFAPAKAGGFRLSYVADFLRTDVLAKVLPFFIVYGGYLYARHVNIVIPGLDLEKIMDGVWIIALAALTGSLLSSLRDLGLLTGAPAALNGPDPTTPTPPAPPNL